MKIIDMHCHILPGIDDGPENMDRTLQYEKSAEQNIYRYIATPACIGKISQEQTGSGQKVMSGTGRACTGEIDSQIRIRSGQELMWSEDLFPTAGRRRGADTGRQQ